MVMRIPLHLNPNDYSPETCRKRYDFHVAMMQLNPKGWRKVGKKGPGANRLSWFAKRAYGLKEIQ